MTSIVFPEDFLWGTATAAYQIEGAHDKDGRGPGIWDTFSNTPGHILQNHNGNTACDHYNRLDEDLDLIGGLGAANYRFSLSWSRIIPDGLGATNPKGVDFYDRLVDGLLERGITPWTTLYHWDLPQALQDKGGWTNRDINEWFCEYIDTVTGFYGDRVQNWMLVNEPNLVSWFGHGLGFHAPGIATEDAYLKSAHNLNRVISSGYRHMKSIKADWNVGSTFTLVPIRPEKPDTPDKPVQLMDAFWNRSFYDPLLLGRYPDILADRFDAVIQPGDMDHIKTDLDFVGVQHYNPIEAREVDDRAFGAFFGDKPPGMELTGAGWSVNPDAFYEVLVDFKDRYGDIPVIVTENGCAYDHPREEDGVHDVERIRFFQRYIAAAHRALADGVNLKGYFAWSLMDNFEWGEGYTLRFGLIHVDYDDNCTRTPKDSYHWYQSVVTSGQYDLPQELKTATG